MDDGQLTLPRRRPHELWAVPSLRSTTSAAARAQRAFKRARKRSGREPAAMQQSSAGWREWGPSEASSQPRRGGAAAAGRGDAAVERGVEGVGPERSELSTKARRRSGRRPRRHSSRAREEGRGGAERSELSTKARKRSGREAAEMQQSSAGGGGGVGPERSELYERAVKYPAVLGLRSKALPGCSRA